MKSLAIVCAILFFLPFVLGYIHAGSKKGINAKIIYYRYFVVFNVIIAALFVTGRMFMVGPEAAAVSGWAYSPVFHLYGIALFSMALLGLLTLFKSDRIMLASAMCWSIFLVLSSVSHLYQIYMHEIKNIGIIAVHIGYNAAVALILWRYIVVISRHYRTRYSALM